MSSKDDLVQTKSGSSVYLTPVTQYSKWINKENIFLQIHLKSKLSKIGITVKAKK